MTTTPLLCKHANQIDLVDYLGTLGFQPQKIRMQDYWYLSPLRVEQTPSFKVNRRLNVWYDHGLGRGGTLVDFGILFYGCTVNELLSKLTRQNGPHFSFHQQQNQSLPGSKVKAIDNARITVISEGEICDPTLLKYLQKRNIPEHIAKQFCKEVTF